MLEFQLFRIKVYLSDQSVLYERKNPSDILTESIESLPSAELPRGKIWHLGNVHKIDTDGLYFRMGKATRAKREIYQDGNFIDEEFEEAPYTHVILHAPLEVCAIAKKPKLSPTPARIANQLIRLLGAAPLAKDYGAAFEIDSLKDPKDLITHVKQAYTISRFSMTFSRPNPFDVEEHFIRPFSEFVRETEAEKGKAQIEGENLKPEPLEDLIRSAAATGNDAAARLQLDKERKPTTIHLRENPVLIQRDDVSDDEQKSSLLRKIKDVYEWVRGEHRRG